MSSLNLNIFSTSVCGCQRDTQRSKTVHQAAYLPLLEVLRYHAIVMRSQKLFAANHNVVLADCSCNRKHKTQKQQSHMAALCWCFELRFCGL